MKLHMNLGKNSYDIIVERGILAQMHEYVNVNRKVMIITDDGIPKSYSDCLLKQCENGYRYVIKQGEESKSITVFTAICNELLYHHFSRHDLIIALGGGVVGDLAGFVASAYMRGIDFIQIPTTTLSQIDSSIGGKVAINLDGIKNIIGAFYQPQLVLIDPDTLKTLPKRHYINGLAEALKAGLIYDESLFTLFEHGDIEHDIETIIEKALAVKKDVVEQDEKEKGLRKILNFGHTIGHAIESAYHLQDYYHGECVAMGMLYFISDDTLRKRVLAVYDQLGLPKSAHLDSKQLSMLMRNDKKADGDHIDTIWVDEPGKARIETMTIDQIVSLTEKYL